MGSRVFCLSLDGHETGMFIDLIRYAGVPGEIKGGKGDRAYISWP
jgi:hypothetical protein